jgi:hypothetical protein
MAMNKLKIIWQTFIKPVRQVCLIPESIANAARQRQQRIILNELETERLDRIRNPSKYLGK